MARYKRCQIYKLFIICTGLIVRVTVRVKNSFKRTECMKEVHSKHMALLMCKALHFLYMGDYDLTNDPTDVYLITVGRSGTLFTLNFLHQIRASIDDSFKDICEMGTFLYPYLRFGKCGGSNVKTKSPNSDPRIFFSHAYPRQLPDKGKFVYVIRDPIAVITSWSDTVRQAYNLQSSCTIEDIFHNCISSKCYYPGTSSIWQIHAEWWQRMKQLPNNRRLWMHYEDIASHKRDGDVIKQFSQILSKGAESFSFNKTLMEAITERTSLSYTRENVDHFNCRSIHSGIAMLISTCQSNSHFGIQREEYGFTGYQMSNRDRPTVSDAFKNMVQQKWRDYLTPVTGFNSYNEMLQLHLQQMPGEMSV